MHGATFKLTALAVCLAISPLSPTHAQRCQQVKLGRSTLIAGAFVATQATTIALRHNDWWPGPSGSFEADWSDVSPSKGQDRSLHGAIAYQVSQAGALAWDWACFSRKTAGWLGAAMGVAFSLPKEIGDGFQIDKGFSVPDMLFTTSGAILPALHRSYEPTQVLTLKVFYWPSQELLDSGDALPQLENDYAGQRYYLTLNPGRLRNGAGPWPDWLGIALGHSVPYWASQPPVHEWYVTLDLDMRGLPVNSGIWGKIAAVLDQIHFPMPGIRVREGEVAVGVF